MSTLSSNYEIQICFRTNVVRLTHRENTQHKVVCSISAPFGSGNPAIRRTMAVVFCMLPRASPLMRRRRCGPQRTFANSPNEWVELEHNLKFLSAPPSSFSSDIN